MVAGCSGLCSEGFRGAYWVRMHTAGHAEDRETDRAARIEAVAMTVRSERKRSRQEREEDRHEKESR